MLEAFFFFFLHNTAPVSKAHDRRVSPYIDPAVDSARKDARPSLPARASDPSARRNAGIMQAVASTDGSVTAG